MTVDMAWDYREEPPVDDEGAAWVLDVIRKEAYRRFGLSYGRDRVEDIVSEAVEDIYRHGYLGRVDWRLLTAHRRSGDMEFEEDTAGDETSGSEGGE